MTPSPHSELSPSSAHRWMNCAGSVALARKAPPPVTSPYADEGTRAHRCLEFLLRRLSAQAQAKKNARNQWSAEMIETVSKAVKAIEKLCPSKSAKLLCEHAIFLDHLAPEMRGTLDAAWVEEWGELVAVDYKHGQGVEVLVKEEDGTLNPQLMLYAAGLAKAFDYSFDRITLAIIQPRIFGARDGGLSTAQVSVETLEAFESKVKTAAKATQDKRAPLCAGDWCKFCPAASICPEISTKALARSGVVFDLEHGIEAKPDPAALTPDTLGKLLPAFEQLETWMGEVRAQAFLRAERGERITGYKLVNKRSTRVWLPAAEKAAKKKWGKKIYSEPEFLSPAQLEKVFGKDAQAFTKKFTSDVSSGTTLVKASDPRSEVQTALVFDTPGVKSKKVKSSKRS